jgi:SAM-dependent methyltransferase
LDVGAGSGSYEPDDRRVVAVEPSTVMIGHRPVGSAAVVRGVAEALPFPDHAFDAALAVLTTHHWQDRRTGLDELCRVAPLRVVVTFDPIVHAEQWVVREYVPQIAALDAGQSLAEMADLLGAEAHILPLTRDFEDGVLGAYWCRPRAYLDPQVRQHMSGFAKLDPAVVDRGMRRLQADLDSGSWAQRHAALDDLETYDAGFRLLVSRPPS